jgi:hypothetical protein
MQPSLSEVQTMVAEIDTDGSGAVDFEEFLQVNMNGRGGGDGCIDPSGGLCWVQSSRCTCSRIGGCWLERVTVMQLLLSVSKTAVRVCWFAPAAARHASRTD